MPLSLYSSLNLATAFCIGAPSVVSPEMRISRVTGPSDSFDPPANEGTSTIMMSSRAAISLLVIIFPPFGGYPLIPLDMLLDMIFLLKITNITSIGSIVRTEVASRRPQSSDTESDALILRSAI